MKLEVALNGTDKNPFEKYMLLQNPFPQIAEYEYTGYCLQLQKLGGAPIPKDNAENYIRDTLKGFSKEFVNLCVERYKPGEYVKFEVQFNETR